MEKRKEVLEASISAGINQSKKITAALVTTLVIAIIRTPTLTVAFGQGLPIFPGAEGFGTETVAGSGRHLSTPSTTVYKVTTLNEGGPGSLRECVEASGARTCIFEVSGTIVLNSMLRITNPYITIAGQTSPSPGITLRGHTLAILTNDVAIQHIRIRVGDATVADLDGVIVTQDSYNIVLDHVSISWAIDENVAFVYGAHDVTVMNSIISEALHNSVHSEGPHSKGVMVARSQNIAVINNIMAHNDARNPVLGKAYDGYDVSAAVVNNLVYNWGGKATDINEAIEANNVKLTSVVGNAYIPGLDDEGIGPITIVPHANTQVYLTDNTSNGILPSDPWEIVEGDPGQSTRVNGPPIWPAGLVAEDVAEVENYVIANSGARSADRDAVDTRIIDEIITRTGSIIDSQDDVGGWPILTENTRVLTLPDNPDGDDDGDGYTNLENWLHEFAAEVEGNSGDPRANAGPDQTVSDGDGNGVEIVTLDGLASYDVDGTIVSYEWRQGTTPLGSTAIISNSFAIGIHTLILTVTDNDGATDSDNIVVTVNPNQAPAANAGADQTVTDIDWNSVETVILDGSGSFDPDGTIASFEWIEDTTVLDTGSIIIADLSVGVHTVTLTVRDNLGVAGTDTSIVTVEQKATLDVTDGYDQKSNVTLSGIGQVYIVQASDANRWETESGYYTSCQFADLPPEATAVASVTIYVEHHEESGFRNGKLEWQVGTGWQVGNPTLWGHTTSIPIRKGLSHETTDSWEVSNLVNTPAQVNDLEFAVKNNDSRKKTLLNYIYVLVEGTVGPQPPVADAGPDQSVSVGTIVTFDGSGSYDPDGIISSFDWDFGDGSPHGNGMTTTHSYVSSGTYTVTLMVTDNSGAIGTDTTIITVSDEAQAIELGVVDGYDQKSGSTLSGSGQVYVVQTSDADRLETDVGYYTSFELGNLPPEVTTVASVTLYVEHHEEPGFRNGQLEWQIGTGWQEGNPTIWASLTSVPIRKDVSNETIDSWDVSSWVNTPAQVNDLEFAIRNNDARKKTLTNYVYVEVELSQGLAKLQVGRDDRSILPQSYSLSHNYPNPFNPTTTIQYDLPVATFVTIRIFDVLGQEAAVLLQEYKKAGRYSVAFDAKNLPSGIYLYHMQTADFAETKKLLLLR